jgi:protein-S-isoprenylcysteine O-methyltransferase Ste14
VQVVAALLMLWARLTFGLRSWHGTADPTAGGLITKGPYRFLRHPIYAAIAFFVGAGVASHASVVTVAMAVLAFGAIAVRIGTEERLLIERYPEYAAYAARTKRIIPFVL